MGTLRTLFAISVVFSHSIGFVFVGGQNAVRLFYMISGFLISYILVEKKSYSNVAGFYINRYLRLYPIYGVIALLSLSALYLKSVIGESTNIFKIFQEIPISAVIFMAFSNATMLLQDWVMFLGIEKNELVFSVNYSQSDIVLYHGLLVPQAWTLGVELSFYAIAPFILLRKWFLYSLLFISIALRVYLIQIGLGQNDPWHYRFFPTELALFLFGAVAHQIALPFYRRIISVERMGFYAEIFTYCLIIITLIYWLIPMHDLSKTILLLVSFFVLMPFAFIFQTRHYWDKYLGDLSYPIYISHLLVFNFFNYSLLKSGVGSKPLNAAVTVFVTILLSILLIKFVANPVEAYRNRIRAEGKAISSS